VSEKVDQSQEKLDKNSKLTPMMDQYRAIKAEYPDCLLFYRLGDFYEMFFEDAVTAAKELELTLTTRNSGLEQKAPMCGVPYHAVESYIQRLVNKGYKVAVCDQLEDPKLAKGLVKRDITRIVTPGTSMNAQLSENNNYIACVNRIADAIGLAVADITTGEFLVTEIAEEEKLMDELAKFQPSEILVNQELADMQSLSFDSLRDRIKVYVNPYPSFHFQYDRTKDKVLHQFGVLNLEGLGMESMDIGVTAAGALLEYLEETQKRELTHINHVKTYSVADYMVLDAATRRNLELTETLRDKSYHGSLLWVLDQTQTAMGGRLLRKWLEQPLIRKDAIDQRLDCVENFVRDPMLSQELKELLSGIYDMERLMGRVSYGSVNARDLVALKNSLLLLPGIINLLSNTTADRLLQIQKELDPLDDIAGLLDKAISDEPPISLREGGLIKTGYDPEVDRLRSAATDGTSWLAQLEAKEKEATGIKNLKVGYNRVFGYYLEVSKGQTSLVPDRYIRKQTLVNGERYITEELKNIEDTLLGAKDRLEELEYDLFQKIRQTVLGAMGRIQSAANLVAELDSLRSLGDTAYRYQYVRPQILPPGGELVIKEGRHPVVERMLPDNTFIANDTDMNMQDDRIAIITGPNMGGKSTYMRQVAAIVLMAQIGSFVPADSARISIADRIFTRVGASDDLARGQSTFMVEMSEVSNILRHATRNSLLILDEIGRGTSTFDGLSLAWAVVEYISDPKVIGAKTLFATHYHELTQLEGQIKGVRNYSVTIKESGEDFIFLHKIQEGGGDQSYGIEVARLAGLPHWVLKRAHEILADLLGRDIAKNAENIKAKAVDLSEEQMSLFAAEDTEEPKKVPQEHKRNTKEEKVLKDLRELDLNHMTPLQALQKIYEWQSTID
jgi:DNA mismatch repair protein MutS